MNYLILSGMMRSGTTLLQRVMNAHPDISCTYQDHTQIFLDTKISFLNAINNNDYHIFSHYDAPHHYPFSEFNDWLSREGQDFINQLEYKLNAHQGKLYSGVKEVLIEEFFPYLVSKNFKCILIIRDPRDVISSMSFGEGTLHAGKKRPVLFDIRNWRKSVVIAEKLKGHKNFFLIRFEDLLINKDVEIERMFDWCKVSQLSVNEIIDALDSASGNRWKGNSSFKDRDYFDINAIGTHKNALPQNVQSYIEAVCANEMASMGYNFEHRSMQERINIINNYNDPFSIERPEFIGSYSSDSQNVSYEIDRLAKEMKM